MRIPVSIGYLRTYRAFLWVAPLLFALFDSTARAEPRFRRDFHHYTGSTPLAEIEPGTVLQKRVVPYSILGFPLALKVTQLLYRSTGSLGQPTVNVTSVVQPLIQFDKSRVISYQSAYDSLSVGDQPSTIIAGGLSLGGILPNIETVLFAPFLIAGYSIIIADTEGQGAHFAAGPEYGFNTLDSIRAALASSEVGLPAEPQIVLVGYSGGAIATGWASELAPSYAPELEDVLAGAAMGGVLVSPAHNLYYVEGTDTWAGVIPLALIGVARAFAIDFSAYLSDFGARVFDEVNDQSIISVLGKYPGLTWAQLTKPEYAVPERVPEYVAAVNQLILGVNATPTIPIFIGQGAGGEDEGTPGDKPNIGPGDGVMIAGDVRSMARAYCDAGLAVQYNQYDDLSHTSAVLNWLPQMLQWVQARLDGRRPPNNCDDIAPGNSLAAIGAH